MESGLLKLVWSWRGEEPSTTVVVPRTVVADGTWHDVAVSITAANITVVADQKATLVFNHHQERLIATDGIFYLGEPSSFHSHSHSCRISGLYTEKKTSCARPEVYVIWISEVFGLSI